MITNAFFWLIGGVSLDYGKILGVPGNMRVYMGPTVQYVIAYRRVTVGSRHRPGAEYIAYADCHEFCDFLQLECS